MNKSSRRKKNDGTASTRDTKTISNTASREIPNVSHKRKRDSGQPKSPNPKATRASMVSDSVNITSNRTRAPINSKTHELFDVTTVKSYKSMKKLKNAFCGMSRKSSSARPTTPNTLIGEFLPNPSETHWMEIDTIDQIGQFISDTKKQENAEIRISDEPRVTVVAEKFTRFRKDDIEMRKLDTKIVCIEYDVFDAQSSSDKPMQKMRAFFSVKPTRGQAEKGSTTIPSEVLKRFNITENEFQNLCEKEIEVIDGKLPENRPYVDDLRKILKKNQALSEKKAKDSLDLMSMYRMAKMDSPPLDCDYSNTNLLSKAELDEVKELILMRCDSPDNISRRKVRRKNNISGVGMKSENMFLELLREQGNN